MTRINTVSPADLTDEHLLAEWRELPRIFRLVLDARPVPERYTLGTGHMRFFLARLGYLGRRHASLTGELLSRGYDLTPHPPLPTDGGSWEPDDDARRVNVERLIERLRGAKKAMHYRGVVVGLDFYDHLLT